MTLSLHDPTLFRQQCHVDGAWIEAANGASLEVTNPASGTVLGTVPALDAAGATTAVAAAHAAFPGWAARTAGERALLL
ncbi:MAG: aldehyde dehydrogenase family protein, partial [Gammaproteobacteria bacterium]